MEDRRRPEDVVAQIDLAMCQWLASLPEHCAHLGFSSHSIPNIPVVQWDPNRKVDLFFNQSAVLHVAYYSLKITVHRIFLSSDRKDLSDTLPSLAVCTHAARASINIVDTQRRRVGKPLPQQMVRDFSRFEYEVLAPTEFQHNVFVAGLILLRSLYSGGRDDVYLDAAAQVNDVHKCINILKVIAPR